MEPGKTNKNNFPKEKKAAFSETLFQENHLPFRQKATSYLNVREKSKTLTFQL
jgi:hypothetical protein